MKSVLEFTRGGASSRRCLATRSSSKAERTPLKQGAASDVAKSGLEFARGGGPSTRCLATRRGSKAKCTPESQTSGTPGWHACS
eukprot:3278301-Pyramimonas_sp.AAC.1